jgi:hypothetical protein
MLLVLNITPLHTAATISDAAGVLDALTDDPQQVILLFNCMCVE